VTDTVNSKAQPPTPLGAWEPLTKEEIAKLPASGPVTVTAQGDFDPEQVVNIMRFVVALIAPPIVLWAIGFSVGWVRRGFQGRST
jgi:predicted cobalt transporter CbtA